MNTDTGTSLHRKCVEEVAATIMTVLEKYMEKHREYLRVYVDIARLLDQLLIVEVYSSESGEIYMVKLFLRNGCIMILTSDSIEYYSSASVSGSIYVETSVLK